MVALAVALLGASLIPRMYAATTTLRVRPAAANQPLGWDAIQYADRLMNTYSELITSDPMDAALAARLGRSVAPAVEVELPANTELLQITVEDREAAGAAAAANALAELFIAQVRALDLQAADSLRQSLREQLERAEQELLQAQEEYAGLPPDDPAAATARRNVDLHERTYEALLGHYEQVDASTSAQGSITVIAPATPPTQPLRPSLLLSILLGLIAGGVGGIGMAFLFEHLDTTLHSSRQIAEAAGLALLGRIPAARRPKRSLFRPNSPQAEALRQLRTNLLAQKPLPRTLLLTSARPGEGKSTIVSNLATIFAQTRERVVVVDADMRLPALHTIFDLSNTTGLSSVLSQQATVEDAVQLSSYPGVWIITSGPQPQNPAELLGSPQMSVFLRQLAMQFDAVLIDAPSMLAVTDAAVLAPLADAVVLVAGRGQVRREDVEAACRQLTLVDAHTLGLVVNQAEPIASHAYYVQK
jgi:succinoglycan biosynthesis transport protein ExoP